VPIEETDTTWSLFQRVEGAAERLLEVWLPRLMVGDAPVLPPPETQFTFRQVDLPSREVRADMPAIEIFDRVRAFEFPGTESPYVMRGNNKQPLTISKRSSSVCFADAGRGRTVYFSSSS
jgi:methionyl-tRNA formyltransferase